MEVQDVPDSEYESRGYELLADTTLLVASETGLEIYHALPEVRYWFTLVVPLTVSPPEVFASTKVPVPLVGSLLIVKLVVVKVLPELNVSSPPSLIVRDEAVALLVPMVIKSPFIIVMDAAAEVGAAVAVAQVVLSFDDCQVAAVAQSPEVWDRKYPATGTISPVDKRIAPPEYPEKFICASCEVVRPAVPTKICPAVPPLMVPVHPVIVNVVPEVQEVPELFAKVNVCDPVPNAMVEFADNAKVPTD